MNTADALYQPENRRFAFLPALGGGLEIVLACDLVIAAEHARFGFPETHPPYDFGFSNSIAFQPTWWIDPEKDMMLTEAR